MKATERSLQKRRFEATRFPEVTYDEVIRWIETVAGEPTGGTCINLMPGYGHMSARLARRWNCRIVAIEPDDRARSEAARRNGYSSLIYMKADESRLPVQNGEASMLFAWNGSVRVDNVERLVDEMRRILAPGSTALFVESGGLFGISMNFPDRDRPRRMLSSTFLDRLEERFSRRDLFSVERSVWNVPHGESAEEHARRRALMVAAGLIDESDKPVFEAPLLEVVEQATALVLTIR